MEGIYGRLDEVFDYYRVVYLDITGLRSGEWNICNTIAYFFPSSSYTNTNSDSYADADPIAAAPGQAGG